MLKNISGKDEIAQHWLKNPPVKHGKSACLPAQENPGIKLASSYFGFYHRVDTLPKNSTL
jgi:hypothetical protein